MRALAAKLDDSLDSGVIPDDWLDSHLTPVPKPNKDHSRIAAYQIITMQNTVGETTGEDRGTKAGDRIGGKEHTERLHG